MIVQDVPLAFVSTDTRPSNALSATVRTFSRFATAPRPRTVSSSSFPFCPTLTTTGLGLSLDTSAALRTRVTSRSKSALGSPFKYVCSSDDVNSRSMPRSRSRRRSSVRQERTTRIASNRSGRPAGVAPRVVARSRAGGGGAGGVAAPAARAELLFGGVDALEDLTEIVEQHETAIRREID